MDFISSDLEPVKKDLLTFIKLIREYDDIDPYIKDELEDLNRLGFITMYSCSGHTDRPGGYVLGIVSDKTFKSCIDFTYLPESRYLNFEIYTLDSNIDVDRDIGLSNVKRISKDTKTYFGKLTNHLNRDNKARAVIIRMLTLDFNYKEYFEKYKDKSDGDEVFWMSTFKKSLRSFIEFLKEKE